jgi:hypothetical protein
MRHEYGTCGRGRGRGEFNAMYTVSRKSVNWLQSYAKGRSIKPQAYVQITNPTGNSLNNITYF